jgi:hypothetical protein
MIEFFVCNLKNSIIFKVSAHSPQTLDEAYGLAMNFKREVNSRMERKNVNWVKNLLSLNIMPIKAPSLPSFPRDLNHLNF